MSQVESGQTSVLGVVSRTTVVLIVGYVFIGIAANLTVLKSIDLVGSNSIPVGSLLFAISYTWIDLVNENLGHRRAHWLVCVTAGANLLLVLWLEFYVRVGGSASWRADPAGQNAIETVLGSVPRIVAGSFLASLIAENLDVAIYHRVKVWRPNAPIWLRGAVSNAVSAPTDAVLFPLLALSGTLPDSILKKIIVTSVAYKLVVSLVSLPLLTFARKRRWRNSEGTLHRA